MRFLDKKFTWPTVTDHRKYSHRVLLKLAQEREKLKEGMRVIDAHVQFMCENLKRMPGWRQFQAKQVHGNPLPHWPSDLDHEAALDDAGAFSTFHKDIISGKQVLDPIEDDHASGDESDTGGDAEEMDW